MKNVMLYEQFYENYIKLNEELSNREQIIESFNYFGDIKLADQNGFLYHLNDKIGKAYVYVDYKHVIIVDTFALNKDQLNKNYTKMFFSQLCDAADSMKRVIAFSPKVKVHSLKMFKDMGFVENLGKNKVNDIRSKLYRKPVIKSEDENI